MKRFEIAPREGWQARVEELGFVFHTLHGEPYWDESACYLFDAPEIDKIELAANHLHEMCLAAVEKVISQRLYARFDIPELAIPLIESSWESDDPSIYGRFDFAYAGSGEPKLLEYNADTPTSLFEASVVQWFWLKDGFPEYDQFNSLHERLIASWKRLRPWLKDGPLHFASVRDVEDFVTVNYLRDTAQTAGLETVFLHVDEIGFDSRKQCFVDLQESEIVNIFKLYPWEWMVREDFSRHLGQLRQKMFWIEPAWKMILSNKAILALLWELYPDHPNLLPAYQDSPGNLDSYVKKPLLAREGANLSVVRQGELIEKTGGVYDENRAVYQQLFEIPQSAGQRPVFGVWLVDGWACGMGVRETSTLVTTNLSRFVPHGFA